jgi:hypothetical protein
MTGPILAAGILTILLVALNAWGIRGKIPMLRSPNKLVAAGGWTLLVLVWLTVAGMAAPPTNGPSSSPTRSPTALNPSSTVTSTPRATPSVVAKPTPTPTIATPAPTQKAVVVVATPKPTVRATAPPPPPPAFNYCGAPANPWHYNFCGGSNIYNPPNPTFCNYFACIASFWNEDIPNDGFVIQCADGTFSLSGGERGSCSSHGGNSRPLYAP